MKVSQKFLQKTYKSPAFSQCLDDLSSRFILNVPEEDLTSCERVMFQIEEAYWFYEDFYRDQDQSLPHFKHLKGFAAQMFSHCTLLQHFLEGSTFEEIFRRFTSYKCSVPVCGAILVSPDLQKCLLVKGWSSRASWGFPKGKINKDEPEIDCAVREVYEETGYRIPDSLISEDHFITMNNKEKVVRLYIVAGVSEDTPMAPRTRKEISKIQWYNIDSLCAKLKAKKESESFFMVLGFLGRLQKWIKKNRARLNVKESKRVKGAGKGKLAFDKDASPAKKGGFASRARSYVEAAVGAKNEIPNQSLVVKTGMYSLDDVEAALHNDDGMYMSRGHVFASLDESDVVVKRGLHSVEEIESALRNPIETRTAIHPFLRFSLDVEELMACFGLG